MSQSEFLGCRPYVACTYMRWTYDDLWFICWFIYVRAWTRLHRSRQRAYADTKGSVAFPFPSPFSPKYDLIGEGVAYKAAQEML